MNKCQKRGFSKKAQIDLPVATLIELIILAVLFSLFFTLVYKETVSTKFDKMFLARDSAMFIDTLYASPNKIIVKYPQKTRGYNFKFQEGKVVVYEPDETIKLSEEFPFSEDKALKFDYKTIPDDEDKKEDAIIVFYKTEDELIPNEYED